MGASGGPRRESETPGSGWQAPPQQTPLRRGSVASQGGGGGATSRTRQAFTEPASTATPPWAGVAAEPASNGQQDDRSSSSSETANRRRGRRLSPVVESLAPSQRFGGYNQGGATIVVEAAPPRSSPQPQVMMEDPALQQAPLFVQRRPSFSGNAPPPPPPPASYAPAPTIPTPAMTLDSMVAAFRSGTTPTIRRVSWSGRPAPPQLAPASEPQLQRVPTNNVSPAPRLMRVMQHAHGGAVPPSIPTGAIDSGRSGNSAYVEYPSAPAVPMVTVSTSSRQQTRRALAMAGSALADAGSGPVTMAASPHPAPRFQGWNTDAMPQDSSYPVYRAGAATSAWGTSARDDGPAAARLPDVILARRRRSSASTLQSDRLATAAANGARTSGPASSAASSAFSVAVASPVPHSGVGGATTAPEKELHISSVQLLRAASTHLQQVTNDLSSGSLFARRRSRSRLELPPGMDLSAELKSSSRPYGTLQQQQQHSVMVPGGVEDDWVGAGGGDRWAVGGGGVPNGPTMHRARSSGMLAIPPAVTSSTRYWEN